MISTRGTQFKCIGRWLFCVLLVIPFSESSVVAATIQDVDTNQDGVINFVDFLNFAANWDQTAETVEPGQPLLDWDNTGRVDFGDFLIFASFFGQPYGPLYPVFSLSGLSDTLAVGQADTLVITLDRSSVQSSGGFGTCDVLSFIFPIVNGVVFDPIDTVLGFDPIIATYQVTGQEPGEFLSFIKVQACGPATQATLRLIVENP